MCMKSTVSCTVYRFLGFRSRKHSIWFLAQVQNIAVCIPPFFLLLKTAWIYITDNDNWSLHKGYLSKKNHPIENICKTVQSSDLLTVVVFLWISRCAKSYLLRFIREITNYTYKYFQLRHMLKMKTTGQHLEIFIILNWRTWYLSRMFSTYVSDCSVKHSTAKKETDKSFNNLHIVPLNSTLV